MANFSNLPDFDSLPAVPGMPSGCAWGVFDKNGEKDILGCLNLLTADIKREAFKEARDGVSISLNWPLNAIAKPGFGRRAFEHVVISVLDAPNPGHTFDDEVAFNTQSSSQWDGLVHFGHQPTGLYYNASKPTKENLMGGFRHRDKTIPTLNHWHQHGGLVGRGVLLDYVAFAAHKGIKFDCFDSHSISIQDLEVIAEYQGTTFKPGDILLVRTGYTERLDSMNADEQEEVLTRAKAAGVEANIEAARWLWNHRFAAVAGDTIAFEVLIPRSDEQIAAEGGHKFDLSQQVTLLMLLWREY